MIDVVTGGTLGAGAGAGTAYGINHLLQDRFWASAVRTAGKETTGMTNLAIRAAHQGHLTPQEKAGLLEAVTEATAREADLFNNRPYIRMSGRGAIASASVGAAIGIGVAKFVSGSGAN